MSARPENMPDNNDIYFVNDGEIYEDLNVTNDAKVHNSSHTDVSVYAVWALDSNDNLIPDYSENQPTDSHTSHAFHASHGRS